MSLSYAAALVRAQDNDRFLCALFAPQEAREALFAIAAFNVEIAKTREVVSEALLGEIRLQWWRDALDAIMAGKPPHHPVVEALAMAVARHGLGQEAFRALIEARAVDLEQYPPPDLDALERYAEDTSAPLSDVALDILGVRDAVPRQAARRFATSYALAGIIRAVPYHAAQRRLLVPADVQARTELDARAVLELKPSPALSRALAEVGAAARRHFAEGTRLASGTAAAALPALLPGALARLYLTRLERAAWNPFDRAAEPSRPAKQWHVLAARLRGRV